MGRGGGDCETPVTESVSESYDRPERMKLTIEIICISAVLASMTVGSSDAFLLPVAGKSLNSLVCSTTEAAAPERRRFGASTAYPEQATPQRIAGGDLLSLGFDELAEVLDGSGRARMVWAALSAGVDPFSKEATTEFLTDKTAAVLREHSEGLPWKVTSVHV